MHHLIVAAVDDVGGHLPRRRSLRRDEAAWNGGGEEIGVGA